MSNAIKRFERMRANPRDNWRVGEVEAVCAAFELDVRTPKGGGSHITVSHPSQRQILTIPAKRPIKPVYIRNFVRFVEAVRKNIDGN